MRVFVAGGTGVLGRETVRALSDAGHDVYATARSDEKAALVRRLGGTPVDVDLYDPDAARRAVAGCDAVLRLTTKIPAIMKMGKRGAWTETNRLRTIGARTLVQAVVAERIPVYIHESVVFVYHDGGDAWLNERSTTSDGGTAVLRAALEGERAAARVTEAGGRGIVLRFGGFYGPDAPSTLETAALARRRALPQIGPGTNFVSSIYVPDAARAVAAALTVPAGTYNVCDDAPVRFAEYLRAMTEALGAPRPRRLPAPLGRLLFGEVGRYVFRSLRVSNRLFRDTAHWAPAVAGVSEGWRRLAMAWGRRSAPAQGACAEIWSGERSVRSRERGGSCRRNCTVPPAGTNASRRVGCGPSRTEEPFC